MAIGNPINLTSNVEGKNISVIATAGQTQFTVTGGYRINQISVFRNGVRLVDGRDFTALDGSIVTLLSAATVADVIEFQVFDDFRVSDALSVNSGGTVNGNVTVTGILSTTNLSIGSSISLDATTGIITAVQVIGGTITGTATTAINAQGLTGTPDITVNNIVAAAGTFSGVLTYEDVTNVDSVGVVTARQGVVIIANGLDVAAGIGTFAADVSIADKIVHTSDTNTAIRFPSNDTFTVETSGIQRLEVDSTGDLGLVGIATATGLVVVAGSGVYAGHTGIITAVTFDGNVTGNISGGTVAGSTGTFTGEVNIADKIVHTGDTNTTIRFPSNDTFTVETTGVERLRVDSDGDVGLVGIATATGLVVVAGSGIYAGHTGVVTAVTFDGNVTGNISGGTVAGSTGTFTGDVDIADKIVHTGDTNTAIRFPAADTFTVETGGSERIRVDSGGRLGIGTATPSDANSNADDLVILATGGGSGITIFSDTDNFGNIFFGDGTSSAHRGRVRYDHSSDALTLSTSATEALRVDSSQRLLVNTTSSTSNIAGYGNGGIQLNSTTTAQANVNIIHRNNSGNTHAIVLAKARDGAANGGRVQDDDDFGAISFQGFDGTGGSTYRQGAEIRGAVDGTPGNTDMPGRLEFLTTPDGSATPTERLRITSAGRFGFNTSSPDGEVHIEPVSTNASIILSNDGRSQWFRIQNNETDDALVFNANDSNERLRIDSSGRLLVGRTSASDTNASANIQAYHSGGALLVLGRDDTSVAAGDNLGEIRFISRGGSADDNLSAEIQCEADDTHASNDTPGRLVFRTTPDSSTSPTERLRITHRGSFLFSNGLLGETVKINSTARTGTQAVNLDDGMVHYFTSSSTGTWKPNFTMSAAPDINSTISTGDVVSPTMIVNKSNTAHYADSVQVDGSDRTIEWLGGAPTAGGGNNTFDVYSYTIIKTGSDTFAVFGSVSNYT